MHTGEAHHHDKCSSATCHQVLDVKIPVQQDRLTLCVYTNCSGCPTASLPTVFGRLTASVRSRTTQVASRPARRRGSCYCPSGCPCARAPDENSGTVSPTDKGGNVEDFQEITRAFDILGDARKRAIYDEYGEEGFENTMAGGRPCHQKRTVQSPRFKRRSFLLPSPVPSPPNVATRTVCCRRSEKERTNTTRSMSHLNKSTAAASTRCVLPGTS